MSTKCDLANKKCVPCQGGVPALEVEKVVEYQMQLGGSWTIVNGHHLEKEFTFDNFVDALDFTNKLGAIAEEEGHHPDILLSYGKVAVTIWTHKIDELTESDFILAAKCDEI